MFNAEHSTKLKAALQYFYAANPELSIPEDDRPRAELKTVIEKEKLTPENDKTPPFFRTTAMNELRARRPKPFYVGLDTEKEHE